MTREPLKLTAADWCYFKGQYSPEAYYTQLKSLGYVAAEMVAPERRAAARAAGLRLLNFSGPRDLNRAENREKSVVALLGAIESAAENKIEQVIVFCGNRGTPPLPDSEGRDNCIAALKGAARAAERAGVVLTFEVFNQFDHPDYQADSGAFAFDVVRGVSSPAVKVLYDLYHMHRMKEDVIAAVVPNLDLIAHLHIAGSPKRDYPGADQEMDYPKIVRAISAAGYRGHWGMEFKPVNDSLTELKDASDLFNRF